MTEKLKIILFCALLFAAVAVDFASKLMSVAFDFAFVAGALIIAMPMLTKKKET